MMQRHYVLIVDSNRDAFITLPAGAEDWRAVEAVPGVWRFLRIADRPAALPDGALGDIQAKEAELEQRWLCRRTTPRQAFKVGQPVTAKVGPFADVLAKIERFDERGRAVLLLEMLGGQHQVVAERAELIAA